MACYHMRNFMTKYSCNLSLHGRSTQQLQQASVHNHLSSWNHKCIDLVAVNDSKLPLQALQSSLYTVTPVLSLHVLQHAYNYKYKY